MACAQSEVDESLAPGRARVELVDSRCQLQLVLMTIVVTKGAGTGHWGPWITPFPSA